MEQEKETIYLVELSQTEIESIISALDTVVKAHGISVAEKCGALHRALVEKSNPKEEPQEEPQEEEEEEVSLEEVKDELEQIMKVPKKKKRTTKKKK
tara:strand:+ start:954 stop:1244 length:291 start_codon:yes stop_codon:yes gene_type:complete